MRSRRLAVLIALAAMAAGCASDKKLVANAAASYQYSEARYEWACVDVVAPPECQQRRDELKEAKRETVLCNEVQKVGKLPKVAKKRLRQIVKELPQ